METSILAEKVARSNSLVGKIQVAFEEPAKDEPKTLAEAVSNKIMGFMPRISPELFELKRKANVPLTKEQKDSICEKYISQTVFARGGKEECGEKLYKHFLAEKANMNSVAEIPFFAYAIFPDESEIKFSQCAEVFANTSFQIATSNRELNHYDTSTDMLVGHCQDDQHRALASTNPNKGLIGLVFPPKEYGVFTLDIAARWVSPFKLDVGVKVPGIPETFLGVGDEAISLYYQHATKVPNNLKRTTTLIPPRIGVLWAPTDKSLYATGKIPEPKLPPTPKRDPLLVLDILDGKVHYRHAVAAWNIDEEMPFKNWVREYSEGSFKNVKEIGG